MILYRTTKSLKLCVCSLTSSIPFTSRRFRLGYCQLSFTYFISNVYRPFICYRKHIHNFRFFKWHSVWCFGGGVTVFSRSVVLIVARWNGPGYVRIAFQHQPPEFDATNTLVDRLFRYSVSCRYRVCVRFSCHVLYWRKPSDLIPWWKRIKVTHLTHVWVSRHSPPQSGSVLQIVCCVTAGVSNVERRMLCGKRKLIQLCSVWEN